MISKQFLNTLRKHKRFLVVSHLNPEGDAIASTLAMGMALEKMGKKVEMFNGDLVPENFRFLPGADRIRRRLPVGLDVEVAVLVDCGELERAGDKVINLIREQNALIVNIDHHVTNDQFGDFNCVNSEACAAGEIIYTIIERLGVTFTPEIAQCLYTAILTDTGSFRYSSVTPKAFRIAAKMVELGAQPWEISSMVYENFPPQRLYLIQQALATLEVSRDRKLASITITRNIIKKVRASKSHTDGLINYPRSIAGVEVSMVFRETGRNRYKVSFRSKGALDVARIAVRFGGGGHKRAAGCSLDGSLTEVKKKIYREIRQGLREERI